ncbi:Holliday junction recognition protein isoform X1 [Chiroxiphia lanceolata]|uniref:Holliday junction recognition protein isoform X1 n=1 Tax=Chiroxiphia lanceolata TaxID=296741 RepID=UPI0013CE7C4D|nr:Holliday junction recognition protein isoform X1 [Chiroxiphia lanceolata]
MDFHVDAKLQEQLRQSSARFMASVNRILERYNHPFEDDYLVSMETLTYDTPDGPKKWGNVSTKNIKKWRKEILKHNRRSRRNAETSKQRISDFEGGHSSVHQESPENTQMDTSDIDEASDVEMVSVRRKFEGVHLQNLNVDDGKIQEKVKVPVDVIVQDDARKIPRWIEIPNVDDKRIQEKVKVPVDVIVQDDARKIPRWIEVTPQCLPKGFRVTSSVQELIVDNQATVCRKKLELSNECSSSRFLQLQYSGIPIPSNTKTIPTHRPSAELNTTYCDSVFEECRSACGGCSLSNTTLADLYPVMLETFTRLMTKHSQRKVLKYLLGHLRSKRCHSRRPKINITVDKIRGFRPFKLKKGLYSICSSRSEDNQNPTFGNESREFSYDNCLINNSSALVPYTDTNEFKMDYSDSSLEHCLVPGKGQKVSIQTVFPNVMARMGETFVAEDELQTTASVKSSEYKESEKLAYRCSSEHNFVTPIASSESTVLHLVKESKAQKTDFSCGTSDSCSSACSSYGSNNTSAPVTNYSSARASNTLLINPEKIISEGQISFQHKHSFSSSFMKQTPSKMPQKYEDAFEKLYYKVCSEEIQKPLVLRRPPSSSQNLEEKGGLMKSNLSVFVKPRTQYDREFDRIYEQLCSEPVPKLPGLQRASNLRKYEGIKMSETVNALVNSPVRTLSAIPRVKRLGNFQNDLPCSPVKRLKHIPEHYFSSTKCQEISHRKKLNLQTVDMDFLSTYNGNNPGFFEDHSCQSQHSGFRDSSDKTSLDIPGTYPQEAGIAYPHSGWPRTMMICSSPRNVQMCHQRVYRKLSYTDGKDQNPSNTFDFPGKTHQGAFIDC